jgi:hypothetical protein
VRERDREKEWEREREREREWERAYLSHSSSSAASLSKATVLRARSARTDCSAWQRRGNVWYSVGRCRRWCEVVWVVEVVEVRERGEGVTGGEWPDLGSPHHVPLDAVKAARRRKRGRGQRGSLRRACDDRRRAGENKSDREKR